MTRNQWRLVYQQLPPGDLRDRIAAAGKQTKADEFGVWMSLEEASASGVEELVIEAVDNINQSWSEHYE